MDSIKWFIVFMKRPMSLGVCLEYNSFLAAHHDLRLNTMFFIM